MKSVQKSAEEKYRHVFHYNPMVMYVAAIDGLKILEVNQMAVKEYGYTQQELLQMNLYDLRLHQDYNRLNVYIAKISSGKEVKQGKVWQHIRKNGEKISMQTRFYIFKYNEVDAILIMANNVREKIQLLQRLAHEGQIGQQEIAKAVLAAQEKQRSDIGKELHDNVNQILATSRLFIDVALSNNQV